MKKDNMENSKEKDSLALKEEEVVEESEKTTTEEDKAEFKTTRQSGERNWYVIHTYSGYEEQVAENLKQRIESFGMENQVFDVIVPKEKQIEIRN